MTALSRLTGQVLDEKYRIDKQLGEGGMGAVFLATHLGTERPVALKVIAPQFMRNDEFVERFRREAKAAGRLQHPNVVDVTDFGFARVGADRVAYLVMEYLDGCPLSDILAEESQLPVEWVVDILEQTCSAVEEAHRQGTIHRDLKPDNIWLEPNRRGGYTVKVLDFGLAKLGDAPALEAGDDLAPAGPASTSPPSSFSARSKAAPVQLPADAVGPGASSAAAGSRPALSEAVQPKPSGPGQEDKTQILVQSSAEVARATDNPEAATQLLPPQAAVTHAEEAAREEDATRVLQPDTVGELRSRDTAAADGLTRVGSILGTPLYMSPEQCSGGVLDARSDIYSLGVIAYQMLAGQTPFVGDMTEVMRQQIEAAPPPLTARRREVPKRMAALVMSALAKDPAERPSSAAGFASALRANSEGTGRLLRRAFALYSEHFPPFFRVSLLGYLPLITFQVILLISTLLRSRMIISPLASRITDSIVSVLLIFVTFVANAVIVGMTIRLVTQLYLAPLRPIRLGTAYSALRRRLKPLLVTTLISGLRMILGFMMGIIPAVIMFINYSLSSPVVMTEGLKGRAALMRSKALVKRARRTVIVTLFIQWAIPAFATSVTAAFLAVLIKGARVENAQELSGRITSVIVAMLNVFIIPLISTLTALLYLKARQAGGETLTEALSQFEEEDVPRTKWQLRMRERTSASGGSR